LQGAIVSIRSMTSRSAGAIAAVLLALLMLACSGRVKPPQNNPQPQPQPQPPVTPKADPLKEPVARFSDVGELFDLGEEGEAQYKGKVVSVSGKVNLDKTKKPAAGETSTVVLEGDAGGPPHALATVKEDSAPLLSVTRYGSVPSVHFHAVYRGRDERGTILLEPAKVMSVTRWFDWPRKKKDGNKTKPEPKKPAAPLAVSAEKMAQDFMENPGNAYRHYGAQPVKVTGVVAKRQEDKGAVVRVDFTVPSKDKKTDWTLIMIPRKPIPVGDKAASDLAVGKTVTLRGNVIATGIGATTITECGIVRE
jgi:tRNA_anti-like